MMKLLQLTDIHLTAPGQLIDGHDPIANFDRALAQALTDHADAEALFLTGDLSDLGAAADYARLRDRLADLPLPVHLLIGNHDHRDVFLDCFPECEGDGGFVQHVVPLSLGHGITLDTWGPDSHAGHFCETRAAWLAEQLERLPGPVWIFQHHNPVPMNIPPMDGIMLLDAERYGAVLAPHRDKIAHIFFGHCHLPLSGSFHGIPFSAPRGTNQAGWADFSGSDLYATSDLPPAYSVIFARPDSTMVHMVEFGYDGAVRRSA
ncbi:MAG: phosphodiesterase [Silicimonas sp.]|nr:phosphodiesterase [Silicimonas sp.]